MNTAAALDHHKVALSIQEFCQRYGLGRTRAYEEISSGRLRARKAGGRTLIASDDAQAWLDSLPEYEAAVA